jgi:hypothetical protein
MDYTILYVLGIIIFTLGISFGLGYLKKKNIIKADIDDIIFVVSLFNLSVEVVDELNLKQEPLIKKIADIVSETLEYIASIYDENVDKHVLAYDYACNLALKLNIELTDNRKNIINSLIDIGINSLSE